MTRSKCQPCITISTIWKLAKIHYKHFLDDIRAFNQVKEYSCDIHYSDDSSLIPTHVRKTLHEIRETAEKNYVPITAKIPEEVENEINQILKETA